MIGTSASRCVRVLALLLVAGLLAGCDEEGFPRDPDHTLQRVLSTGEMTVAAVDSPPWVILAGDAPLSGAEVVLVEAFADELGVEIDWRHLSAFEALEGLEQGDLDLAIGGFTRKDVSRHAGVAATYGYFTETLVVAAQADGEIPTDIEGQLVFLPPDVMATDLVRDEGAVPTTEMGEDVALVAVPHWRLESEGLLPTGIRLRQETHVMVVPQGENAWVMRIETFLRSRSAGLADRLRAYER